MESTLKIILEASGLRKSFDQIEVLRGIDLEIADGEVVAIIGPSGVGKSTLLRCINLLENVDEGLIRLNGQVICQEPSLSAESSNTVEPVAVRRIIGMVFQEFNLWPNLTLFENIAEGLRFVLNMRKSEVEKIAIHWAQKVGLADKLNSYPSELSGGQKQRGAIARALAMNPEILMLDEITSALDPSRVSEILSLIAGLKENIRSLVIVTHHIEFAKAVADRVVFMYEGRTIESGPPKEVLEHPQTQELIDFLVKLEKVH